MNTRLSNTIALFGESVRSIDISAEGWMEIISNIDTIQIFANVPDPRMPRKTYYRLDRLLTLIFLAILKEGNASYKSIADHIYVCRRDYHKLGLIESVDRTPSHDIIRYVLMILNNEALARCTVAAVFDLMEKVKRSADLFQLNHLMVDGKEMRGSGRSKHTQKPASNANMVNVYDGSAQVCLFSIPVDTKSNEIPKVQELLELVELKGTILTADALHTQKETANYIHSRKGYYVLPVKDNQKLLRQKVEMKFENLNDRKIKRIEREKRTFWVYKSIPKGWEPSGFKGLKCFVKMESHCHSSSDPCCMYFIANTADLDAVIEAIESRWGIENGLHQLKDSSLINEDRIQYQNRNALKNIATINNLIASVTRIIQNIDPSAKSLAIAKKTVRNYPLETLKLVAEFVTNEEIEEMILKAVKKNIKKKKASES